MKTGRLPILNAKITTSDFGDEIKYRKGKNDYA
jgi:hypothetical protein